MASTERIVRRHFSDLAAIIVDPLSPRLGLLPATAEWLQLLRCLCDELGIVLISDEVISFRIAHGGTQQAFGFRADLTALGKIIGGGFPVGAVGGRADVMSVFDPRYGKPAVPHGGTFNANPITMVAGRVSMELMTRDAYDRLAAMGDRMTTGIQRVFHDLGEEAQITGRASLRRIHFTSAKLTDYRSAYPSPEAIIRRKALYDGLLARGFVISPTGMIALSTAVTEPEIDQLIEAVRETLR